MEEFQAAADGNESARLQKAELTRCSFFAGIGQNSGCLRQNNDILERLEK